MPKLLDLPLVDASVNRSATFGEAARVICESGLSAVAVLDETGEVIGLFTEDDLLAGLFPPYLAEIHHTAFASDDPQALEARVREVENEPLEGHVRKPVIVEADSSTLHAAEMFLHCEWGALAIVEHRKFLGMLAQIDFCRSLMRPAAT